VRAFAACLLLIISGATLGTSRAAEAPALRSPGTVFRDCADCPELVVIPAGSNDMGSDAVPLDSVRRVGPVDLDYIASSEAPRHRISIARPYALGRYEITRAQYARFVAETARPDPEACAVHDAVKDSWAVALPGYSWRNPSYPQQDDHPVACTNFLDASDYAAWLSRITGQHYRLPSEAEWEYAARAGTHTARYWGDSSETICERAQIGTTATAERLGFTRHWRRVLICGSDRAFTLPVGSFAPNPFGLYDMLGNVVEVTADCFHDNFTGAPADGSVWNEPDCHRHVGKGGGFLSPPLYARAANRGASPNDLRHFSQGFRLLRELP
jgi:formylglycine-generating enzyme required for sulfatase activity